MQSFPFYPTCFFVHDQQGKPLGWFLEAFKIRGGSAIAAYDPGAEFHEQYANVKLFGQMSGGFDKVLIGKLVDDFDNEEIHKEAENR